MRILFLNPQGNFDQVDSYLTQHPDFGGQLVYVKETAKALSDLGHEVDIITRQIIDDNWKGFESKIDYYSGAENLRIIRLNFGGNKFLQKELLWPHINDFVNAIVEFYSSENKKIDFITSHYGDGGITAALLSKRLNVPYSFTGHSLGAQKIDKILAVDDNIDALNKKYNFNVRIAAERISMNRSSVNIVSTSQERYDQYSHLAYKDIVDPIDDGKFKVIAPGVNLKIFNEEISKADEKQILHINSFIHRDITSERTRLPYIVASSRLDLKKNHEGIIKAYANSKELQNASNLMFVIRGLKNPYEDYSSIQKEEKEILDTLMNYINDYHLRGKVCFIDIASQQHLAVLYKYLSTLKSVFALTSLFEPFGLAPLEAMACGLPAVVTKNGGPEEIFIEKDDRFGCLVDPVDHLSIEKGLLETLNNWDYYKVKAVKRVLSKYTWENTAKMYLDVIKEKINEFNTLPPKINYIENIENFAELITLDTLTEYFKLPILT